MTLREILVRAQEFIGAVDLTTDDGQKLLAAGRFVCAECADRYADLLETESVYTPDGEISFSDLSKPVKRVNKVKKRGIFVPFSAKQSGITTAGAGEYEIEYAYFSTRRDLDEDVEMPIFFGLDTLALGTAAEYFFKNGFTEEGLLYKNRYDSAVRNDLRVKRAGRLPFWRFI